MDFKLPKARRYKRVGLKIVVRVSTEVTAAGLAGHICKVIEDSGNISVLRVGLNGIVLGNPAPKLLEGEVRPGKMKV